MARAFAARDTSAILAPDLPNGEHQDSMQMAAVLRGLFVLNQPPISVRYRIKASEFPTPDRAVLTVFQQATRYQDLAASCGAWTTT